MCIYLFEDLGGLLSLVQEGQSSLHQFTNLHDFVRLSLGLANNVCIPNVSVWKEGNYCGRFCIYDSVQFSYGVPFLL